MEPGKSFTGALTGGWIEMMEDGPGGGSGEAPKDVGCTRDMVSMQGLGYKEILAYLDGEISLEEAV